jgi:hypothetical protein
MPLVLAVRELLKRRLPRLSPAELEARALVLACLSEEYAHLKWTYGAHLKLQSTHARLLYEFRKLADGRLLAAVAE